MVEKIYCVRTLMGPGHHRVQCSALFLTLDAVALSVFLISKTPDCIHNHWFS